MADKKRYHAFDALRASMMFLGVVIHSAINYNSSDDPAWPLRSSKTSDVFYYLVAFIHAFRMPVFFLIAGFFGALLFLNKGPGAMLKNRIKRIFLPFVVFLLILQPFLKYSFQYCTAVFEGEEPTSLSRHFSSFSSYIPYRLSHLWFLYYLFIISVLTYLFSKITKPGFLSVTDQLFEKIFKSPVYRLLMLTGISFLVLFVFGAESFETSVKWLPEPGILVYFFAFYITGWLLYRNKELVLSLKRFDMAIAIAGLLSFAFTMHYRQHLTLAALQLANSFVTCTLSLGIIGLFLRFADAPSYKVSYLVNSAYWVYLIHFFIAILLSGLIEKMHLSVYLNFLIVFTLTTFISLGSYHFLVRKTLIGTFLNGKKEKLSLGN